jgi:type II secretory pathway pseudopilin PulG
LRRPGFSLLESLICMSLFLFIFMAAVQFFSMSRDQFEKLRNGHETGQAVSTALEKIRLDLQETGRGLVMPQHFDLMTCIDVDDGSLALIQRDTSYRASFNLTNGQTRVTLNRTSGLRRNHKLCFFNRVQGEIRTVLRIEGKDCILQNPIQYGYSAGDVSIIQLKEINYYLDERSHILRRKVNNAPAQPLLEDTAFFLPEYDAASNLAKIRLALIYKEEKIYALSIYPKNTSLSRLE